MEDLIAPFFIGEFIVEFTGTVFHQGSLLSATFSTGIGAALSLFIACLVLIGFVLLAVLTPWPGYLICVGFTITLVWLIGIIFVVGEHKNETIPDLKSLVRDRLKSTANSRSW